MFTENVVHALAAHTVQINLSVQKIQKANAGRKDLVSGCVSSHGASLHLQVKRHVAVAVLLLI